MIDVGEQLENSHQIEKKQGKSRLPTPIEQNRRDPPPIVLHVNQKGM